MCACMSVCEGVYVCACASVCACVYACMGVYVCVRMCVRCARCCVYVFCLFVRKSCVIWSTSLHLLVPNDNAHYTLQDPAFAFICKSFFTIIKVKLDEIKYYAIWKYLNMQNIEQDWLGATAELQPLTTHLGHQWYARWLRKSPGSQSWEVENMLTSKTFVGRTVSSKGSVIFDKEVLNTGIWL